MDNKTLIERLSNVADEGFAGLAWMAKCKIEELEKTVHQLNQRITQIITNQLDNSNKGE